MVVVHIFNFLFAHWSVQHRTRVVPAPWHVPTSLLTVLFAARFCAIFNTSVFIINIMPTFLGISLVGGGGGGECYRNGLLLSFVAQWLWIVL